jgi:hypothetical protein
MSANRRDSTADERANIVVLESRWQLNAAHSKSVDSRGEPQTPDTAKSQAGPLRLTSRRGFFLIAKQSDECGD